MARAYLKIGVEPGKEKAIKEALMKIEGVKAADLTSGEQDIISVIEAGSFEELLNLVVSKIRPLSGITSTITNMVLE